MLQVLVMYLLSSAANKPARSFALNDSAVAAVVAFDRAVLASQRRSSARGAR